MKLLFSVLLYLPLLGSEFKETDADKDPIEKLIKQNRYDIEISRLVLKDRLKVAHARIQEFEAHAQNIDTIGFHIEYARAQFHRHIIKEALNQLKDHDGK